VKKILLALVLFFVFSVRSSYASLTLPTPNFPDNYDDNPVCNGEDIGGTTYTCYNNYLFHYYVDVLNSDATGIVLNRLVCPSGTSPLFSTGWKQITYNNDYDQFLVNGGDLPECTFTLLGWRYPTGADHWSYDSAHIGVGSYSNQWTPFTDPSQPFPDQWYSNYDFQFGSTVDVGSDYGSLGLVHKFDILDGPTATISGNIAPSAPEVSCSSLDLFCNLSKFFGNLFAINGSEAQSKISDSFDSLSEKAPFAYVNAAFSIDFSEVDATSTPTFTMPLFASYQGNTTLDTSMSLDDTSGSVSNLISLVRPALVILFWLTFVVYLFSLATKVL